MNICVQHKSDLIRLELISKHGGVWADATTFCAWPLEHWLPDCMAEGFFAFRRDIEKTPTRPIANWFMAATPNSLFSVKLRELAWKYWQSRTETEDYFWFHLIFSENVKPGSELARMWTKVPHISCIHPFHFGPNAEALSSPATEFHMQLLRDIPAPVYKLTHKLSHPCGSNSLLSAIAEATSTPIEQATSNELGLNYKVQPKTLRNWVI